MLTQLRCVAKPIHQVHRNLYSFWFLHNEQYPRLPCRHNGYTFSTSVVTKTEDPEGYARGDRRNFDHYGSWNNRMDWDIDMERSIHSGKLIPKLNLDSIGVTSLLGRRKVNEDRFDFTNINPSIQMFAIYDGHGGSAAADFTCKHMRQCILNHLEQGTEKLEDVLSQAFLEVNHAFTHYQYHNHPGDETALKSGTTATVCLLRNGVELVVAHVGDSKAMLCRVGKVVRLTLDHKPDNEKEAARVSEAGGKIVHSSTGKSRVNGTLDMTRSIGDVKLKSTGVIAEPTLRSLEVKHGKDAFLVLATDGVTYVVADQEIIDYISKCQTAQEGAGFLTDQALLYGSEDNCTAMVVPLGAWGKYAQTTRTVNFSFGRNIIGSRYG